MRAAARALYRGRQFLAALVPHVDADLQAGALRVMTDPERRLFESMMLRDQQHCLDVYRRLHEEHRDDRDLLAAALLHDIGKGRIALWHRIAYVLLAAGAPGLLERVTAPGEGNGWRQALYRCHHHPELGAAMARRAGCREEVAALIGEEEGGALGERLVALRSADDAA